MAKRKATAKMQSRGEVTIPRARATLMTEINCPNVECKEVFFIEGKYDDMTVTCPECGQEMLTRII